VGGFAESGGLFDEVSGLWTWGKGWGKEGCGVGDTVGGCEESTGRKEHVAHFKREHAREWVVKVQT
jgi:hypothetical protein